MHSIRCRKIGAITGTSSFPQLGSGSGLPIRRSCGIHIHDHPPPSLTHLLTHLLTHSLTYSSIPTHLVAHLPPLPSQTDTDTDADAHQVCDALRCKYTYKPIADTNTTPRTPPSPNPPTFQLHPTHTHISASIQFNSIQSNPIPPLPTSTPITHSFIHSPIRSFSQSTACRFWAARALH